MRPASLREVVERSRDAADEFGLHLSELLDRFYLAGTDAERQACLDPVPETTGDARLDAWVGAAGEHLALRWGLSVPPWALRDMHFALARPSFEPSNPRLSAMLLILSPPAFRRRNLFVMAEPLTRARFPAGSKAVISLDPPSEDTLDDSPGAAP